MNGLRKGGRTGSSPDYADSSFSDIESGIWHLTEARRSALPAAVEMTFQPSRSAVYGGAVGRRLLLRAPEHVFVAVTARAEAFEGRPCTDRARPPSPSCENSAGGRSDVGLSEITNVCSFVLSDEPF